MDSLHDVEVISISNNSVSCSNKVFPSLPKNLKMYEGRQLSNGDLLLCGSRYMLTSHLDDIRYENWHLKDGSNQWTKIKTMEKSPLTGKLMKYECWNSTPLIDGCFFHINVLGPYLNSWIHPELFSIEDAATVKEAVMSFISPSNIFLSGHTVTTVGKHRIFICGGWKMYGSHNPKVTD